jgi:hypothetical protein
MAAGASIAASNLEIPMKVVGLFLSLGLASVFLVGVAAGQAPSPPGNGKVDVKVINYDELAREIVKNKGKVVVVDFWGIT